MIRRYSLFHSPILVAVLLFAGCGGNDDGGPTDPDPVDLGLLVPEQFATVAEALAAAVPSSEVSLAPGRYTVDLSIDRGVVLRRRLGAVGDVVLEGSRLSVRAPAGEQVTLRGLVMTDGDTLIDATGGADLWVEDCRLERAVLGIRYTGSGHLDLRGCVLHSLGPAGAVHVSGSALVTWEGGRVASNTAMQAVVDLRDGVSANLANVVFVDCPRYTIRHRGADLDVTACRFEDATGPSVVVAEGSTARLFGCWFTDGTWPAVEVGGAVEMHGSVVAWGLGGGAALLVGPAGDLLVEQSTIHDGSGAALELAAGSVARVRSSLLTAVSVPAVNWPGSVAATLACDDVDLWVAGQSAWSGLLEVRDAGEGNVEVDPRYCGPRDLGLREGSPVEGLGALEVGCGVSP